MTETVLYRIFDTSGVLLYVGITTDLARRLAAHKSDARWRGQIARVSTESFPTAALAALAEIRAILLERPIHNVERTQGGIADDIHVGDRVRYVGAYRRRRRSVGLGNDTSRDQILYGTADVVAMERRGGDDGVVIQRGNGKRAWWKLQHTRLAVIARMPVA